MGKSGNIGVAPLPLGTTRVFPLFPVVSSRLAKSMFHLGIILVDLGDAASYRLVALVRLTTMVDPDPPLTLQLVAEALGIGAILADISTILMDRFRTVREYGADLSLEKRSGFGIHSFLTQLVLWVNLIPGL